MRSPKDMGIIEIDITNACVHSCANCTRFCGHHEKPFFMSFDAFRRAVDSLADYDGIVGVMGGEPTLHPEFERFADYLREKRVRGPVRLSRGPICDMQLHIRETVNRGGETSNAVLLSSLNRSYYRHFETINDTFSYQLLNDHGSESLHQALLMPRKELGVPDEEWLEKRDACWIQNTWSATVTPKGAFFCEVAGALDMLFRGPGGWPVEPGWWKRTPADFADQLRWCELCGACLDTPKRLSHDERDDVTPGMYKRLLELKSPKALRGDCVVRAPEKYEEYRDPTYVTGDEYIKAAGELRITERNRSLYPKEFLFLEREGWRASGALAGAKDWVVLGAGENEARIREFMADKVWNPGCLYVIDGEIAAFNVLARSIRDALPFPAALKEDPSAYYPDDKVICVSTDDPLLFLLGGDDRAQRARGGRRGKRLLIYGAGTVGTEVAEYLEARGFSDFDVVVTEPDGGAAEVCGHRVRALRDFRGREDEVLLLIAASPRLYGEMLSCLRDAGFYDYRFIV